MKNNIDDETQIDRLSAFSDNIIAFALTLLALNLMPAKKDLNSVLTFIDLTSLFHPFAAFILSFIVVGTLWSIYHELFDFISEIDSTIIVANLLLLFFIVIVPFSAALVSSYFGQTVSTFIYSLNALMLALCLNYMVVYIERHPLYLHKDIDKGKMRTFRVSCNVGIINGVVAVAVSFFLPLLSFIILLARPLTNYFVKMFYKLR
jgi:TMEM175 potassium channel family protein